MRTIVTLIAFVVFSSIANAQSGIWSGPCVDEPQETPTNYTVPKYYDNKFKNKYQIHLKIDQIRMGEKLFDVNLDFSKKIKYETNILELTDSVAVKLQIAKTEFNSNKELLYRLMILKKDNVCWRSLSVFYFNPVWSNKMTLGGSSVGYEGTEDFVQIVSGEIEIN